MGVDAFHSGCAVSHDQVPQDLLDAAVVHARLAAVTAGMRRGAGQDRQPARLRPAVGIPAAHRDTWPRRGCHRNRVGRVRFALGVPAGRGGLEDPCRVTRPALVHSPAGLLVSVVRLFFEAAQEHVPVSLAQRRTAGPGTCAFPALGVVQVRGDQVPQERSDIDRAA